MLNHAMAIVQRTALHRSISKRRDLLPRSASKEMPTNVLCPRRITARVVAADHVLSTAPRGSKISSRRSWEAASFAQRIGVEPSMRRTC